MATLQRIRSISGWIFLIFLLLATGLYWAGVSGVPFHPDESTYLYMSADWEQFFTDPLALAWQAGLSSPRLQYRLLDAPLTRDLAGLARWLTGLPPLPVDWDWSLTWWQNRLAGSLPDPALLATGRFGMAVWFPLSLCLLYLTGLKLGSRVLGWSSSILFATNALILLHTRRAMAEGILVFCIIFFLAALVSWRRQAWLIALPAALAFCAKQSALPLAFVGLLAVVLYQPRPFSPRRLVGQVALYTAIYFSLTLFLNPVLWKDPFGAARAALTARQELLARQTYEFGLQLPDTILNSPLEAGLSLLANLFILPPTVAEVGNYAEQTALATAQYLAVPLHQVMRGLWPGAVMAVLALSGFFMSVRRTLLAVEPHRTEISLVWLAGVFQFLALAFTVTLPFQRYAISLVPFACLGAGWMVRSLFEIRGGSYRLFRRRSPGRGASEPPSLPPE